MYIISKYKDYYDGAVGLGIDKSIIYERFEIEEVIPRFIHQKYGVINWEGEKKLHLRRYYCNNSITIEPFIIGFCGKTHIVFRSSKMGSNYKYTYDLDEMKSLMKKTSKSYFSLSNNEMNIDDLVSKLTNIDPIEIFRRYNTPIFIIKGENISINPILKEYEFMKIYHPYNAFQEIQMFISGVLASVDDGSNIKMTEKDKVNQHGFDPKYSFRKRPKK